jgi:nicotinamide mononucleotide (NMN) deamidase PncC
MAVPGSSSVYSGGTVAYNTRNAKPLWVNNDDLHASLIARPLEHGGVESRSEAN